METTLAQKHLKQVPGWQLAEDARVLERTFTFPDFSEALAFVNRVGNIAEAENHHPDIALSWGKVAITLQTHVIGGLSDNDFILAAKINQILPVGGA